MSLNPPPYAMTPSSTFHRLKVNASRSTTTRRYQFYPCFILVLLALLVASTSEATLSEKIYQSLNGTAACIRRLNATHQVGCGGGADKSYGIVKLIAEGQDGQQETDLRAIITHSTEPTVAVITSRQMFNG